MIKKKRRKKYLPLWAYAEQRRACTRRGGAPLVLSVILLLYVASMCTGITGITGIQLKQQITRTRIKFPVARMDVRVFRNCGSMRGNNTYCCNCGNCINSRDINSPEQTHAGGQHTHHRPAVYSCGASLAEASLLELSQLTALPGVA